MTPISSLGLLQVEGYARAVIQAVADPPLDSATVEQHAEARIRRQDLLTQDGGPLFQCVLDEGALSRPVGSPAVMRAQLERIVEPARLPKVTFQLIPLDVGLARRLRRFVGLPKLSSTPGLSSKGSFHALTIASWTNE